MKRHRVAVSELVRAGATAPGSVASIERVDAKGNVIEHFVICGTKNKQDHNAVAREAARRLRILADRMERLAQSDCPICENEQEIANFDPDSLIGRTTNDASMLAMRCGYRFRIGALGEEATLETCEIDRYRINVEESNGRVVAVGVG